MTKKDFEMIAETIREYRAEMGDDSANGMAHTFARKLANRFPNFNYSRFVEATK